jgi:hypothetical protein
MHAVPSQLDISMTGDKGCVCVCVCERETMPAYGSAYYRSFWLLWGRESQAAICTVAVCWSDAIAKQVLRVECRTKTSMVKVCYCFSSPFTLCTHLRCFAPSVGHLNTTQKVGQRLRGDSFSLRYSHPARLRVIVLVPVRIPSAATFIPRWKIVRTSR